MTFVKAAIAVLESTGQPMSANDITTRALHQKLIASGGKTPTATMAACLYLEVRDNPKTRFVRVAEPGSARARRGSVKWALKVE